MNVTKLMYVIDLGCHRRKTVQARTLHWRNRLPNKNLSRGMRFPAI